jgi:uncharacterized protein (TIGR02599 family)
MIIRRREPGQRRVARGFTLIELLVSTAVFSLIMVILLQTTSSVGKIWSDSTGRIEQFRSARTAFEAITRRLSQATLNTYWDYDNPSAPTKYLRQSELRFISGRGLAGNTSSFSVFFQAALGVPGASAGPSVLRGLLNTCGYYVHFGTDAPYRPPHLASAAALPDNYRFRLIEMVEPSESLAVYRFTSGKSSVGESKNLDYVGQEWFTEPLERPALNRVLAENIVALIVLPKLPDVDDPTGAALAPDYGYDSTTEKPDPAVNPKNQIPPIIRVTLVAIDGISARRLENGSTKPDLGLGSLFASASSYESDLATFEQTLQSRNLNYRIFSSDIAIAGARWSREQTD